MIVTNTNKVYASVKDVIVKKFRDKLYYTLKMEGSDLDFKCGEVNPGNVKGKKVGFYFNETQYGPRVNTDSLKVYDKPPATGSTGGTSSHTTTKDDYWTRKEENDQKRGIQISYQAATNTAIEIINFAVAQGILKLGTKSPFDAYRKAVQEQARELFELYKTEPFKITNGENNEDSRNDDLDGYVKSDPSPLPDDDIPF